MDPLTQFDQLGPLLGGVLAGLRAEQLDDPTPCADFTVRGVLEHMTVGAMTFAAMYRGDAPRESDSDDPVAGTLAALGELAASISAPGALGCTIHAPFGDVDGETFARFIVLDGLVHGWDLATASGQAYEPPIELVEAVDGFARGMIDGLRDGETFGPATNPAHGSSPIEILVAFTGRSPGEDPRNVSGLEPT